MATITSPSKAPFNPYPVQALEMMHNELDSSTAFRGLTACTETDVQTMTILDTWTGREDVGSKEPGKGRPRSVPSPSSTAILRVFWVPGAALGTEGTDETDPVPAQKMPRRCFSAHTPPRTE